VHIRILSSDSCTVSVSVPDLTDPNEFLVPVATPTIQFPLSDKPQVAELVIKTIPVGVEDVVTLRDQTVVENPHDLMALPKFLLATDFESLVDF
jgi:hypothetical protein